MSTTRHVTVWCDATDCHGWIGQEDTAADARSIARNFGWKRRNGRDLCPEHADSSKVDSADQADPTPVTNGPDSLSGGER